MSLPGTQRMLLGTQTNMDASPVLPGTQPLNSGVQTQSSGGMHPTAMTLGQLERTFHASVTYPDRSSREPLGLPLSPVPVRMSDQGPPQPSLLARVQQSI